MNKETYDKAAELQLAIDECERSLEDLNKIKESLMSEDGISSSQGHRIVNDIYNALGRDGLVHVIEDASEIINNKHDILTKEFKEL